MVRKMVKIYTKTTEKLSSYRTQNTFLHIANIKSIDDFYEVEKIANLKNWNIFPLGNGSNTFFAANKISSLILKNDLPQEWQYLGDDYFEVSSSVKLIQLLNFLYKEQRDGPYFLASVPATIGGAIAMNAGTGRGKGLYISKFLEEVTFAYQGTLHKIKPQDMDIDYRKTIFSESTERFIIKAVMKFPKCQFEVNPIKERIEWSKQNQDLAVPNCGSVFRTFHSKPLRFLRKYFRFGKAYWSQKTFNWICNTSSNPRHLKILLLISNLVHKLFRKTTDLEIRVVK